MDSREYWNEVAPNYESLYGSAWSKFEDAQLAKRLLLLLRKGLNKRVLDIGCGTGLCYRLLNLESIDYYGVDASEGMLHQFRTLHPEAKLIHADAKDLSSIIEGLEFDLIISANCVGSFVSDISGLASTIDKALAPDGRLYISFLNRTSLRRIVRRLYDIDEDYYTRGGRSYKSTISARSYRSDELRSIFSNIGFRDVQIGYQSVLGGVCESQYLIGIEKIFKAIMPKLSHEIFFVGQR